MYSFQFNLLNLRKLKRYMTKDVVLLGENYSWWDTEEDDIYNEQ